MSVVRGRIRARLGVCAAGGAPNERGDVLTIELERSIEAPTSAVEGTARERLSIRL